MTLDGIQTYVNTQTPFKVTGLCYDVAGMRITLQAQAGRWPSATFNVTPSELALAEPAEKLVLQARTLETVARLNYALTH